MKQNQVVDFDGLGVDRVKALKIIMLCKDLDHVYSTRLFHL